MAQFQNSDIDDAKKRVREMQEKTRQFSQAAGDNTFSAEKLMGYIELLTPLKSREGITPLALFTLVSAMKEDCDKALILAIFYILLL